MEPTTPTHRRVALAAILVIAVFGINSWVRDYIADVRGRKDLALQIERMKSQVNGNGARLNEADARILAQTKLAATEIETYGHETAFYDSLTQVWTVSFNADPNFEKTDHRKGPIFVSVDDTTRSVWRLDTPLPARSPDPVPTSPGS
jgi:hypothetical protein